MLFDVQLSWKKVNRGGQPLLSDVPQALLWQALQAPAPDDGLWNSRKVAEWMSDLLDRPISVQRGWEYLRSLEMRLRVPRPPTPQNYSPLSGCGR